MELTPDWPSASRIRQPRLSVISLLRVPPSTDQAIHASEGTGKIEREGERESDREVRIILHLARIYLEAAPGYPSLCTCRFPLPSSCPFLPIYLFSFFFYHLRSRLRSLLNKRPLAMLQDPDARFILSRPVSCFSTYSSRVSCIFCRVPNQRSEFFFSLLISSLFGLRFLRTDKRVYYSGCYAITLHVNKIADGMRSPIREFIPITRVLLHAILHSRVIWNHFYINSRLYIKSLWIL